MSSYKIKKAKLVGISLVSKDKSLPGMIIELIPEGETNDSKTPS
jgi:hypothetical protein